MVSVGRKRKIHEVEHANAEDDHRVPDCMRNIRTTMAQVKNARPNQLPMAEQIKLISGKVFPGKDEWLLAYLSQVLAKETLSIHDASATWLELVRFVYAMPRPRSRRILRKVDLLSLVQTFLAFEHTENVSEVLSQIIGLIQFLSEDRKTKKLFLSNLERACMALVASLSLQNQHEHIQFQLIDILVDLVSYNAKHRATEAKLLEAIRSTVLGPVISFLSIHDATPALTMLLGQTIFAGVGLATLAVTRAVLQSPKSIDGLLRLCSIGYEIMKTHRGQHAKTMTARNDLLHMWLEIIPIEQLDSLLQIYRESHAGNLLNRPLSSDDRLVQSLEPMIKTILAGREGSQVLITLLQIDLDILYPRYEIEFWNRVGKQKDANLLQAWLGTYIEIRALPSFFRALTAGPTTPLHVFDDALLNREVLNMMALAISNQSSAVQHEIAMIVLDSSATSKQLLLSAVVAGAAQNATLMQRITEVIPASTDANLQRMWSIHVDLEKTLGVLPQQPGSIDCKDGAETWLRAQEISSEVMDNATIQKSLDACLSVADQDVLFLRSILYRWLPTLSTLLSPLQAQRFIQIVFSHSTAESPYIIDSDLLEQASFHDTIQALLQPCDNEKSLQMVLLAPIKFFHNAVRRSMVQQLAIETKMKPSLLMYKVLYKFAQAALVPSFAAAETFSAFADRTFILEDKHSQARDDTTLRTLRSIYISSLSNDICHKIISDRAYNVLIRSEIIAQCYSRDQSYLEYIPNLLDTATAVFRGTDVAQGNLLDSVTVLTYLIPVALQSLPEYSTGLNTEAWLQQSRKVKSGPLSAKLVRIAAWHAKSVAEAKMILCTQVSIPDDDENMAFQEVLDALLLSIPITEVKSLLAEKYTIKTVDTLDLSIAKIKLLRLLGTSASFQEGLDHDWWSSQVIHVCRLRNQSERNIKLCKATTLLLRSILISRGKAISLSVVDEIFLFVASCFVEQQTLYMDAFSVLRAVFQQHTHLLKDRYHMIMCIFQQALEQLLILPESIATNTVQSYVRLFETFLGSCRALSTTPDRFDKAIAKHSPWLLIQYVHIITDSSNSKPIATDTKKILEEDLMYQIMSLCGTHEREMIANSLNAAGRSMFKRLYDDWNKFGKWTEK